ncbi:MAG: tetratricopeptide repeat protein [Chitinophagales bacterium]|nr:tetratricopeptide repeat protein [Chitinophagales bacterium]
MRTAIKKYSLLLGCLLWLISVSLSAQIKNGALTIDPKKALSAGKSTTDKKPTTPKKKKTNTRSTPLSRAYQDLTSRYNRYFNAKLKYTESVKLLDARRKENYNEILPVYSYKGGDGKAVSFNLDEINKKASINIQKKPNSKWVDDSFLILGQSNYLLGNYEDAAKSFNYIITRYGNKIRMSYDKRSKEQEKKLREKERDEQKKDRQYEQKKREAEREAKIEKEQKKREQVKKDQEKARKERDKERADDKKQREKDQKVREKEREKEKKAREKAREKEKKAREKAKKQGKPLPPKTTTPVKTTEEKAEEARLKAEQEAAEKTNKEAEEAVEKQRKEAAEKAEAEAKAAEEKAEEAENKDLVEHKDGKDKEYARGKAGHKPAKPDAMIWLARTFMETNNLSQAGELIQKMKNDSQFPRRKLTDLGVLEGAYHLAKGNEDQAETALLTVVKKVKPRKERARLYYILGQLAQERTDHKAALTAFEKVLKSKPPYEMELNTRLNIVQEKMGTGEFTKDEAIAALTKMSKEDKNIDYADQILFAMADIEAQNGNMDKATAYLNQSTQKSTVNKEQKAKSFLKLAEMNYKTEKYLPASAYYDSTFLLIAKTNPKYEEVSNRKTQLGELARHLKTIELQDSLQRIANMSPNDRKEYLQKLIADLKKQAAQNDTTGTADMNNAILANSNSVNSGGTWYFYNDAVKLNGYKDFVTKYGNRTLSDNWRVASKQSSDLANTPTSETVDTAGYSYDKLVEMAGKGEISLDAIMQKLPISAQQKAVSDSLLTEALFAAANIFKDGIKNDKKAIETFKKLDTRYPNNRYAPEALYTLYGLQMDKKQQTDANDTKNSLIARFPNSKQAKYLGDPSYLQTLNSQHSALEKYYNDTYELYKQEQFEAVKKRMSEVNTTFAENPLQPKFDLLNAFVVGSTDSREAYISALQGVVSKYPTHEVKTKAQEILTYLQNSAAGTTTAANTAKNKKYKYEPNTKHYVVVAFDQKTAQSTTLTTALSNFNTGSFSSDNLKTNAMLLDPQHQIILVKEFNNADKAKVYYNALVAQRATVLNLTEKEAPIFYISKTNFNQYFKDKDTNAYLEYFGEAYLGIQK